MAGSGGVPGPQDLFLVLGQSPAMVGPPRRRWVGQMEWTRIVDSGVREQGRTAPRRTRRDRPARAGSSDTARPAAVAAAYSQQQCTSVTAYPISRRWLAYALLDYLPGSPPFLLSSVSFSKFDPGLLALSEIVHWSQLSSYQSRDHLPGGGDEFGMVARSWAWLIPTLSGLPRLLRGAVTMV